MTSPFPREDGREIAKKTHWRLLKYYSAEPLGQLQQKLAKRFIGRRVFKSVKKTAFFFRNKNKDLWNHFFLSCNSSSSIIIALLAQACLLLGTLYQASSWSLGLLFFCIFFLFFPRFFRQWSQVVRLYLSERGWSAPISYLHGWSAPLSHLHRFWWHKKETFDPAEDVLYLGHVLAFLPLLPSLRLPLLRRIVWGRWKAAHGVSDASE